MSSKFIRHAIFNPDWACRIADIEDQKIDDMVSLSHCLEKFQNEMKELMKLVATRNENKKGDLV